MTIFKNRPLCLTVLIWIAVTILCFYLPLIAKLIVSILAIVAAVTVWFLIPSKKALRICLTVILVVICLALVCSLLGLSYPLYRTGKATFDISAPLTFEITDVVSSNEKTATYIVKVMKKGEDALSLSLITTLWYHPVYAIGDVLYAEGTIEGFSSLNENTYAVSHGAFGNLYIEEDLTLIDHNTTLRGISKQVQSAIGQFFKDNYAPEASTLLSALLIGDTAQLTPQLSHQFQRTGLTHLLSLSGFHVSILVMAIFKFLGFLRVPKNIARSVLIVFIPCYAMVAGLSPSIVRAGLMSLLMILAGFTKRENDPITSLFAAAFLILFFSPGAVVDLGFWLSVVATFGILLLGKLEKRFPKLAAHKFLMRGIIEPVAISLIATILTLPICIISFGTFSNLFLMANLFYPVWMTWFLYAGLFSVVILPLRPLINLLGTAMTVALEWMASWDGALIYVKHPIIIVLVCLLALSTLLLFIIQWKKPRKLALVPCAFAVLLVISMCIYVKVSENRNYIQYRAYSAKSECVMVHHRGTTVVCDINTSSYRSLSYLEKALAAANEFDVDLWYFPAYQDGISAALYTASGFAHIREIALPIPQTPYETYQYTAISHMAEQLDIPLALLDGTNGIIRDAIRISSPSRVPLASEEDTLFASFSIQVNDTTCIYYSSRYTERYFDEVGDIAAPDFAIFGKAGASAPAVLVYPFSDAPTAFVLGSDTTGLALSPIEKELLQDTYFATGVKEYLFPIP